MTNSRWLSQPAFILHKQDWDEKSEQIELLTPELGRILVFCRKEKRQIPLFQQLELDLSGSVEKWRIKSWVATGQLLYLQKEHLYFGLYLNELLMRLWPRQDANAKMFGLYSSTLTLISKNKDELAALRYFERSLLRELGYGIEFNVCLASKAIERNQFYEHIIGRGFKHSVQSDHSISGEILLNIDQNSWGSSQVLKYARVIFAREIDHQLGGQELHSRSLIRQYYQRKIKTGANS